MRACVCHHVGRDECAGAHCITKGRERESVRAAQAPPPLLFGRQENRELCVWCMCVCECWRVEFFELTRRRYIIHTRARATLARVYKLVSICVTQTYENALYVHADE